MHRLFEFLDSGPLLTQWAEDNQVFLFDFDEMMYELSTEESLRLTLDKVKNQNYKIVAVVESHPFFKEPCERDELYKNKNRLLIKTIKEYNLPAMFLTANWTNWQTQSLAETFFPSWFFRLRDFAVKNNYHTYNFSSNRKYNFSCCNMANLRSEKLVNYVKCYNKRRSDWYLTIYNDTSLSMSNPDIAKIAGFNEEEQAVWNNEILPNLKLYEYDLLNGEQLNAFSTIFPGHTDAYCNLVVEHSSEIEIVSEKSFKPFISEQVPLYVGQKGITQFIESLGFDVFKDFIDYSKYDLLDSFVDRIATIHQEIDKLYVNGNPGDFFKSPVVQSRLRKNRELFYSNSIDLKTIGYLEKLKSTVLVN